MPEIATGSHEVTGGPQSTVQWATEAEVPPNGTNKQTNNLAAVACF